MAIGHLHATRDTFLHYLADNLPALTIHNIRFDKSDPKLNQIMLNAVNVTFHNSDIFGPSTLSQQLVTVDVINDFELDAVDQAEQVSGLLFTAGYSPLLDYTIPTAPVQISSERIFWQMAMNFKQVQSENFFHMSALMHLFVHAYYPPFNNA